MGESFKFKIKKQKMRNCIFLTILYSNNNNNNNNNNKFFIYRGLHS